MADYAVALRVAARACVHRTSRFHGVSTWTVDPPRWVKPARRRRDGGGHRRESKARVTLRAKTLHRVAARAAGVVAARHRAVDGQEVVRVNAGRTSPAIVAISTLPLVVALRAHLSVVRGNPPMTHEKVTVVFHVEEPRRRQHPRLSKLRSQHAPLLQMTRRTLTGRARNLAPDAVPAMAAEAGLHGGEMLTRRKIGVLNLVTAQARNPRLRVGLMGKVQPRRWDA